MINVFLKNLIKGDIKIKTLNSPFRPFYLMLLFFITYVYFASSYVWVYQYLPLHAYFYIAFIIIFLLYLSVEQRSIHVTSKTGILLFLCVLIGICKFITTSRIFEAIGYTFIYIPAVLFTLLSYKNQKFFLLWITKVASVVLGLSILIYILLFFVGLPSIGTFVADHDGYPPYTNYIFYLQPTSIWGVLRFRGPFLEPGHLGMACSFLLYANKYDFKKQPYLWILLIADIISFSLSGWMLTLVGICIIKIKNISTMIASTMVIGVVYLFAISYNGGDNDINNLIIERLEFDDEKGIKGNNRMNKQADRFYDVLWITGEIYWGVGDKTWNNMVGAGYKQYFINQGIVSAIVVFFLYWNLLPPGKKNKYSLGFLFVIILCFLSRAYPTWYTWLLPYILGTWADYGDRMQMQKMMDVINAENHSSQKILER